MNNFEKIQAVVLANRKRKITISEISKITSIERNRVNRLLQKFDTEGELFEFIVDGRKCKLKSEPINPINLSDEVDAGESEEKSTNISGQVSYFDLTRQSDSEEDYKQIAEKVCSFEEPNLSSSEELVESDMNQLNTESNESSVCKFKNKQCKTLLYSNLFYRKIVKVLFDSSILDLTINQFNGILKKMSRNGIRPKFIVFTEDVFQLDMKKNESFLAKELLKFFAQDSENNFHELFDGKKPTQKLLGKFCAEYQFTLVSGITKNIVWAKLYNVEVIIPDPFLKKIPNPCHGKGIVGLDSCMMSIHQKELDELLKNYEKILISDIQLEEIPGGYLLDLVALYGDVDFASRNSRDKDQNICNFYGENKVAAMYTIDYGCFLFGKLSHVNCILYDYSKASRSSLLKIANNLFTRVNEVQIGDEIIFDKMTNIIDNAIMILNDFPNISIFTPIGQKRDKEIRKAYSQDFLTIHISNTVIIAQIRKRQRALVLYVGQETDTPREYKKFLL